MVAALLARSRRMGRAGALCTWWSTIRGWRRSWGYVANYRHWIDEVEMALMDLFAPVKGKPAVNHVRPPQPKDTAAGGGGKNGPAATIAKARAANPGKRVVVAG
jgi:hypothetical protein